MKNFSVMARFNTGFDASMISNIENYIKENKHLLEHLYIGDGEHTRLDKSVRDCSGFSINRTHWLTQILNSYIHEVNQSVFKYDLTTWHDDLQFLLYEGKGSGYKWHHDNEHGENETGVRKLSLILSLSDPTEYEGGEFQIMLNANKRMETFKFELGECIVFPSTSLHRVRPLKSGKRSVVVGWYGGPDFR
jgi:PKHD-type hydroxylase